MPALQIPLGQDQALSQVPLGEGAPAAPYFEAAYSLILCAICRYTGSTPGKPLSQNHNALITPRVSNQWSTLAPCPVNCDSLLSSEESPITITVPSSRPTSVPIPSSPAVIPQDDQHPDLRAAEVAARSEGYLYGPSLVGNAAPFPNGTLGQARVAADIALWSVDRQLQDGAIAEDVEDVKRAIIMNGGLRTVEDYTRVLYEDKWLRANPRGVAPGIMTNYTSDLLFSMERLSINPYPLRTIQPKETLPFKVEDGIVLPLAGVPLETLHAQGQLFMVDYSHQNNYTKTTIGTPRYGAACTAYFFIHPTSKDFLPLAIKTNVGKDLIYTPQDSALDWMLAKMMFNVNDIFDAQMRHLVIAHDVSEGVHQAALRTLSSGHPIMVVLDRLMLQAYSSRPVADKVCFNDGGHWDQLMYVSGSGCHDYVTEVWPTIGKYQAAYFEPNLKARGLIDDDGKYPFSNFPFYDDAKEIHTGFQKFYQTFVDSYYATDDDVAADFEVQNWFVEVTKNAKVHDFPTGKATKDLLVDVLTHFGFIVSVDHHELNGADPINSKAVLPFHLSALFAPVPETKGIRDLIPFLPPPANAVAYISFTISFNRPFYGTSGRTLEHAFLNNEVLARLNSATRQAGLTFMNSMQDLSNKIRARTFDDRGLSLGSPFIYRTLDPNYIPFFSAV